MLVNDVRYWSEFQARWQHYASVEFDNDFERASALKLAVNGKAFHTIEPVTLGDPKTHVVKVKRCLQ